jgi:hypothetical protein
MNRRGGPNHHFSGGGPVASPGFVVGDVRAAAAAVAFALHLSVAAFRALASGPSSVLGVILANAALAATYCGM